MLALNPCNVFFIGQVECFQVFGYTYDPIYPFGLRSSRRVRPHARLVTPKSLLTRKISQLDSSLSLSSVMQASHYLKFKTDLNLVLHTILAHFHFSPLTHSVKTRAVQGRAGVFGGAQWASKLQNVE